MGVPRFFRWVDFNFRGVCHKIKVPASGVRQVTPTHIDNFYIDMNGLFHPCAQKVFQYGAFKPQPRLLRPNAPLPDVDETEMFKEVCQYVDTLMRFVNPRKRLVMCVDGVAGSSKSIQQRKRRFTSALSRDPEQKFDSNALTPGTAFMNRLNQYIEHYIHEKMTYDDRWKRLQVVFSNEKVPGEGEHKLIRYMRTIPNAERESHCVHALDADLIMLTLLTHYPRIYLFREDVFDAHNDFHFVWIPELYKRISERLINPDARVCVTDFVFACFLLGNDFLPHSPVLEISNDDMGLLFEGLNLVYKQNLSLTEDDTEVNTRGLQVFLGYIADQEQSQLDGKNKRDHVLLKECMVNYKVDLESYRRRYYDEKLHVDEDEVEQVCVEYLDGLAWVLGYYTRSLPPSWDWYYPHHYTPFPSDLLSCLTTWTQRLWPPSQPLSMFEQLLCVLPVSSKALIPKCYHKMMEDDESPIIDLFPKKFTRDSDGKRQEWESIALLPFVEPDRIRRANKEIESGLRKPLRGNRVGRSYVYRCGSRLNYRYESRFGVIEGCMCLKKRAEF